MFLRKLNKRQKELALGLAMLAAGANNVIEKDEEACLHLYADEMGIDYDTAADLPLDEICGELKSISNSKELNQIVFEIIGLLFSDSEFDLKEQMFLKSVASLMALSEHKIEKMVECVKDYNSLLKRINAIMYDLE